MFFSDLKLSDSDKQRACQNDWEYENKLRK